MYKLPNHLLLLATATVALTFAVGCGGDDPEPEPGPTPVEPKQEVKLSPTALTFEAENASEQTVTVTTASGIWSAKSDQDWCFTSRRDNTTLVVGVGYNYGTTARTATVTVTSGEKSATLSVTQAGSVPTLTVSRDGIHFAPDGGKDSLIRIHCTPNYTDLRCEVKGGDDWLTIGPNDGQDIGDYVLVSAGNNETLEPRSATLTFTLPGAENKVVTVTQDPGYIDIRAGDTISFGYWGGKDMASHVSFWTNLSSEEGMDVECDVDWLTVERNPFYHSDYQYRGEASFTIWPTANNSYDIREGRFRFLYKGKILKESVLIQYQYPRLSITTPHGTALPSSGGSLDIRIYSNYPWKVVQFGVVGQPGVEPWCTYQRINDVTLRFTAPPRQGSNQRPKCYINLASAGETMTVFITEQDGTAGEGYGYEDGTQWDGE